MPTSTRMSSSSLSVRSWARTSQQCLMVSCSRKWSSRPYPGIESSGVVAYLAPADFAILTLACTRSVYVSCVVGGGDDLP